jgi:hypothetical protein
VLITRLGCDRLVVKVNVGCGGKECIVQDSTFGIRGVHNGRLRLWDLRCDRRLSAQVDAEIVHDVISIGGRGEAGILSRK